MVFSYVGYWNTSFFYWITKCVSLKYQVCFCSSYQSFGACSVKKFWSSTPWCARIKNTLLTFSNRPINGFTILLHLLYIIFVKLNRIFWTEILIVTRTRFRSYFLSCPLSIFLACCIFHICIFWFINIIPILFNWSVSFVIIDTSDKHLYIGTGEPTF